VWSPLGLLDVIIPSKHIIDHLEDEEILFLGPDEGTAGVMEWAALYAKERGYPYWKAFTTGKPPSLGGIPHDAYGMTTRSVHQFVLGLLEKQGIQEEDVRKLQIGTHHYSSTHPPLHAAPPVYSLPLCGPGACVHVTVTPASRVSASSL